jgi:nucleoside-diphosphate-sugar epimerase
MRVAVTGGSGRIGSEVVKQLMAAGHDVINIDRRQANEPLARFVFANLGQREQIQSTLEQVEAVCHLGEIPNANVGVSPEQVLWENVRAGSTVLQTCADLRMPRVIYSSTCQVYGLWDHPVGVPKQLPFDETHPMAPHNAYALSKATNEQFARLLARQYGISVAIFRLPWVPSHGFSDSWGQSLREKPASTDGFATYCHVTDVARAFVLAVEAKRDGCEVYHLSAAEIMSIYPLAQRLAEHHPDYPPLPKDWPAFRSPLLTQKACEHLGWTPKWNLLDFYREQHGPTDVSM